MSTTSTTTIAGIAYVLGGPVTANEILGPAYFSFDPGIPDERRMLGAYALLDRQDRDGAFVEPGAYASTYSIIVSDDAFGAGSARPHSAWALHAAGVRAVLARSFHEPFARMAVNEGLFLPLITSHDLVNEITTGSRLALDLASGVVTDALGPDHRTWSFEPPGFLADIVSAGGLVPWMKSTDNR